MEPRQAAVITVQLPAQIVGEGDRHRRGSRFTSTVEVTVDLHWVLAFVPVTVYTVVTTGASVMQAVLAPVLQVYVLAPAAQMVCVVPAQMVEVNGETVKTGAASTTTVVVATVVQPARLVAVSVYTVVTLGQATVLPEFTEAMPPGGDHV